VASVAAACACAGLVGSAGASEPVRTQIVGGEVAGPGTFPWLAHVRSREGAFAYNCTGTVVSSNLVLTAAHCVVDEQTDEFREPGTFDVVTGNVDWKAAERTVSSVSRVLVYPGYEPTGPLQGWGDAALLQLSAPITSPAMGLATTAFWEPGTGAAIVGWGRTSYSQEVPPEQLNWAEVVVQSRAYCEANAPGFHPLGQICTIDAPDQTSGICNGDSGGPLIAVQPGTKELVAIGVSVIGYGECATTKPSLATRSDLIDNWVNNRIIELAPPKPPPPTPPPEAAPELPAMTRNAAAGYVRAALREVFRGRFTGKRQFRVTCRRVEAPKQKCGVNWTRGANDYYGYVTVYYAFQNGGLVWAYRMTVHWVNDWCYFESGYPGSCKVRTVRR
jgi:trypsin